MVILSVHKRKPSTKGLNLTQLEALFQMSLIDWWTNNLHTLICTRNHYTNISVKYSFGFYKSSQATIFKILIKRCRWATRDERWPRKLELPCTNTLDQLVNLCSCWQSVCSGYFWDELHFSLFNLLCVTATSLINYCSLVFSNSNAVTWISESVHFWGCAAAYSCGPWTIEYRGG